MNNIFQPQTLFRWKTGNSTLRQQQIIQGVVCSFRVLSMIFYLGCSYKGLKYQKGNCGVSIVRSGEAMEKALQVIGPQLDLYAVRNKTNIWNTARDQVLFEVTLTQNVIIISIHDHQNETKIMPRIIAGGVLIFEIALRPIIIIFMD